MDECLWWGVKAKHARSDRLAGRSNITGSLTVMPLSGRQSRVGILATTGVLVRKVECVGMRVVELKVTLEGDFYLTDRVLAEIVERMLRDGIEGCELMDEGDIEKVEVL